jgi:hypothetical protein
MITPCSKHIPNPDFATPLIKSGDKGVHKFNTKQQIQELCDAETVPSFHSTELLSTIIPYATHARQDICEHYKYCIRVLGPVFRRRVKYIQGRKTLHRFIHLSLIQSILNQSHINDFPTLKVSVFRPIPFTFPRTQPKKNRPSASQMNISRKLFITLKYILHNVSACEIKSWKGGEGCIDEPE